ncbi:hypothetical protein K439DRAFT_1625338 [Ramaria rubella]|nr:hypothetical protein K439DRAFT_1625338 [Ramaria rubella]
MACVPDCLMMIKMASVLDNDRYAMNRPKLRNYARDERKPIRKNRTGLALIGWDHLKAFCGDDTKKGDKTVIQEGLVSITGQAFQSDDAKKSDTIVLEDSWARRHTYAAIQQHRHRKTYCGGDSGSS